MSGDSALFSFCSAILNSSKYSFFRLSVSRFSTITSAGFFALFRIFVIISSQLIPDAIPDTDMSAIQNPPVLRHGQNASDSADACLL